MTLASRPCRIQLVCGLLRLASGLALHSVICFLGVRLFSVGRAVGEATFLGSYCGALRRFFSGLLFRFLLQFPFLGLGGIFRVGLWTCARRMPFEGVRFQLGSPVKVLASVCSPREHILLCPAFLIGLLGRFRMASSYLLFASTLGSSPWDCPANRVR